MKSFWKFSFPSIALISLAMLFAAPAGKAWTQDDPATGATNDASTENDDNEATVSVDSSGNEEIGDAPQVDPSDDGATSGASRGSDGPGEANVPPENASSEDSPEEEDAPTSDPAADDDSNDATHRREVESDADAAPNGENESAPREGTDDTPAEGEAAGGGDEGGRDEGGRDEGADATEEKPDAADDAAAVQVIKEQQEGLSAVQLLLRVVIVVAVIAVPFWIGSVAGRKLRMQDHGWKIGLVLCTIVAALLIDVMRWPPKLGPDLSGGINLIYEVVPEATDVDGEELVAALAERVNPGGVKEVTIREYGPRQVEIIIPKADDAEVELIKQKISTAGALEFRIVANPNYEAHKAAIEKATKNEQSPREVKEGDHTVARWVILDMEKFDPDEVGGFVTRVNHKGEIEVLVMMDLFSVKGDDLSNSSTGLDNGGRPAIFFALKSSGARRFGELTTANKPNPATGQKQLLGIVLDNTLKTAPSLNEPITGGRGQITGNFTEEEVKLLVDVLNAGRLPAALNPTPISELRTSPTMGADTVRNGAIAMAVSMGLVILFVLYYYRFAGVIACLALVTNFVLLLAVMIAVKAAFTLPGIAGLILTVGMAVDANVLIFERIREERHRGAALRMAIRNGFGRATTTIVDANLTTLITAIVLFWIGTDQIKGFAVTLILGIVMSMYTAIFCSRIIFDIAEKRKWITKLSMAQWVSGTNIDFIGRRHIAAACSIVLILIGLAAVVGRGKNLFDIDFLGGSSVTLAFDDEQNIGNVRTQVVEATAELEAEVPAAIAKIDELRPGIAESVENDVRADAADEELNEAEIQQRIADRVDARLLKDHPVEFPLSQTTVPIDVTVVGVGDEGREFKVDSSITDFKIAELMLEKQFKGLLRHNSAKASAIETADPQGDGDAEGVATTLTFGEPIKHDTLEVLIDNAFRSTGVGQTQFTLGNPEYSRGSDLPLLVWDLKIDLPKDQAEAIVADIEQKINGMTVFPSSSNIGGKVAGDTQVLAGYALFTSLLFIVGYIWLRFQRIMFGLAAVVALVHDVLFTLGVVAASKYLVDYAEPVAAALLIDPFKISLPIVAALLTIIGYSLNDTIVVFDRIREVRGKSPDLTGDMVNLSINQTLSRTLLTSLTTLIVVVVLYIAGGSGIHGFAFCLFVGVVVGTYSSIFVASPVLLWMAGKKSQSSPRKIAAPPEPATT